MKSDGEFKLAFRSRCRKIHQDQQPQPLATLTRNRPSPARFVRCLCADYSEMPESAALGSDATTAEQDMVNWQC